MHQRLFRRFDKLRLWITLLHFRQGAAAITFAIQHDKTSFQNIIGAEQLD